MYKIRPYKKSDFEMVCSWWNSAEMPGMRESMIPSTTYVVEKDGDPMMTACLFLMNCPDGCMVENLVSSPEYKGNREGATELLFGHLESVAKDQGYKTMVIFSHEEKLKNLYKNMGFVKAMDNVTVFSKAVL